MYFTQAGTPGFLPVFASRVKMVKECGAAEGIRTPTGLVSARDPPVSKTGASTDFATAALL